MFPNQLNDATFAPLSPDFPRTHLNPSWTYTELALLFQMNCGWTCLGNLCVALRMRQFSSWPASARASFISSPGTTFHGGSGFFLDLSLEWNDSSYNARSNFCQMLIFFYTIILWCLYFRCGAERTGRSGWNIALLRELTASSLIIRHLSALHI